MTYVDTQLHSYLADFFEAWPFDRLPTSLRSQITPKLKLCSFRPGELIYPARELPSVIHCVVQEQVRLLGPTSYQSPTLAVVGKGSVIGWDSLVRRVAVGSVRATFTTITDQQEVLTLSLPADEFEAIALQHLMPVLAERVSLSELFDALSRFLSAMSTPFVDLNLKDLVQYIVQEGLAVVEHWTPNSSKFHDPSLQLSSDRIWLVSGGEYLNLTIGTPVGSVSQLKPVRPSKFPVRLIGIDRAFLSSALLSGGIPAGASDRSISPVDSHFHPEALALDSSPALAVPEPSPPTNHFPIWKSPSADPVEDLVACFGMICDRFQVPYRPDALRRRLQRSIHDFDRLDLCIRIAEAIGLSAQRVKFTPTAGGINRLATPALIPFRDVLAVLHDATASMTVVGSPRTGLLRLSPDELAARLVSSTPPGREQPSADCYAIVLERLPQTPLKRFGFSWFIPVLAKQRGILTQVLLASMFVQILGLANPLLVQQVIDKVIVSGNLSAMTMFGILMVMFACLEGVLTVLRMYLFASTTHRIDLRLGSEIIRHLLQLPLNFFEKRPVGELSSRLSELENIRQFLTGTAVTAVLDAVFSLFYIGVMVLYSPRLTLCVLATIPIVILSTLFVSTIQRKLIRTKADYGAKVQSYLIEILGGVFTVKAQHMESLVEATWRERYVQYLSSGFTTSTVNTMFSSFSQFLNTMSNLLVLWMGAGLVLEGELTLGGLIAFRILTGYVTGPLLRLSRLWQRFQETSLSMELLADIVDFPAEEISTATPLQLPLITGNVQYQEVSFGFKEGQLQLTNVNLDVTAGSFVGIVGQSGSGKSTLLKLLPRLYQPKAGSILIDGYDISKVDLNSLRSQLGIVPQDAVLFEGTIRDNIALFGSLSDDEVIAAAKVAEAHDFIMQLPEGYSTQVGERGTSLSGGQRQRIAIARVVARSPRLLIFDEATSALDYETERRVCENLMERFGDRTVFFITHRLNTIARADWILFMQSGVIVEQGSHADLMARRQLYYCLYTQQARL
ncbi:peptidase domain-containing ABC transporter [Egbenema bharatensis]|uniref:peptidase domain-containing ABC transporter n=1 Tax=Egbenema bharatensis TaxID=3463334 RepID=UPI003A8838C5